MTSTSILRVLLLGPPGSGKGTQGNLLSKHFKIPQISTGDMLRAAVAEGQELGRRTQQIIHRGGLVPDEIMVALMQARLQQDDCHAGFLLDGFPRTVQQAQALDRINIGLSYVLIFQLDDEEVIKRITGRRIHQASGRSYHLVSNPPRSPGVDDLTGEALVQREDDSAELARKRLDVYRQQTAPLIDFYHHQSRTSVVQCLFLDAAAAIHVVHQRILERLSSAQQDSAQMGSAAGEAT